MADAMDSKSISRKGVGVQVPASAPLRPRVEDELSRALLRVVCHDLANTTQYLTTLDTLLQLEDAAGSNQLAGLAETTQDVDEVGFVLGLLAFGCGADVLLERARRDGIVVVAKWIRRVLRREGRDLEWEGPLRPAVRIEGPDRGRKATWAAARFVFLASRAEPREALLRLVTERRADRVRLACRVSATSAFEAAARELVLEEPRLEVEASTDSMCLVFPADLVELSGS